MVFWLLGIKHASLHWRHVETRGSHQQRASISSKGGIWLAASLQPEGVGFAKVRGGDTGHRGGDAALWGLRWWGPPSSGAQGAAECPLTVLGPPRSPSGRTHRQAAPHAAEGDLVQLLPLLVHLPYACGFPCSETIMFLHQIFYQGLKARISSWPTLVLGECPSALLCSPLLAAVPNEAWQTFANCWQR